MRHSWSIGRIFGIDISITSKDIHQALVMDGGRVAAILCRSDILHFIQLRSELGV